MDINNENVTDIVNAVNNDIDNDNGNHEPLQHSIPISLSDTPQSSSLYRVVYCHAILSNGIIIILYS